MIEKIYDNKYGFSVEENNPFLIFPYLQKKVLEFFKSEEVIDLSRGDPGLGFTPSKKAREFYSFLITIDTILNCMESNFRIHKKNEDDTEEVMKLIEYKAYKTYLKEEAKINLETLNRVIKKIKDYALEEKKQLSDFQILKEIFKCSALVGGTYHAPQGEEIVRIVTAGKYRELLKDSSIKSENLIFTLGVNDAIGTTFKMLGEEGMKYLLNGDTIATSMPAYAPYFNEMNFRKLNIIDIETNTETGETYLETLKNCKEKIKVIFLISPNNPTGLTYNSEDLKAIAEIAEKHDSLIVTDEIYSQLYENFDTIWKYAKKRTIRLCGRSKIERLPGIRFGDVLISDEANKYLTEYLFKGILSAPDFKTRFIWSKAPGGNYASFQHTASVPGPSQILGMISILLGEEERRDYMKMIDKNMEEFFRTLKVPRNRKIYYGIFDLNKVEGCKKQNVHIDQKLYELCTKYGVILIPAMKFFSERVQKMSDKSNFVRVSLPNISLEKVKEAGEKIREYLCK